MTLRLDTHLRLDDSIHEATNLTGRFSPEDLTRLGGWVFEGYSADEATRGPWLRRTSAAMDLAMQVVKTKTFPWPNAANVAFPLVTIAALQFHARAYPALISGTEVVKMRVPGPDPDNSLHATADRVSRYMSYQVLEEDKDWEEEHDRMLISVPIVGCEFKKSYRNTREGHNDSERVPARNLVMNYYARSVEDCPRKTHVIPFQRNDIHEKCLSGVWRDIREETWYKQPSQPPQILSELPADNRKGQIPPAAPDEATPLTFLEQHCWIDFDKDGYAEPYVVTVEMSQRCVVRIVARWERREDIERTPAKAVIRIKPFEYFTKYGFIPSPDGGVYDIGFGILLGPLNESVSTLINQLLDSGSFQTAAGGFLSRGVKIRGGATTFQPFGWQRVDSTGDDLRKGIFPYPKNDPSMVLFQLLSLLVNYAQRISGSNDMMVGENPGQNTPAETSRTMIEQGSKIYNSLFKRVWRCMKEEFKKLYVLNSIFLPQSVTFGGGTIGREDFLRDPSQICPAADPNATSEFERLQRAMAIGERSRLVPGYNLVEVERNILRAFKIENIDTLYPPKSPDQLPPPGKDPKIAVAELKAQGDAAKLQFEHMKSVAEMMQQQPVIEAQIRLLQAQAVEAEANAASEAGWQEIEKINAMVNAMKNQHEANAGRIDQMLKLLELGVKKEEVAVKRIAANKPNATAH